MKKILVVACTVMLIAASGAFAARGSGFGIGAEGSLYFAGSGGLPTGAMLTLHVPRSALMFGVGISSSMALGLTVDYWLTHGNIVSVFDYYAGIGAYFSLDLNASGVAVGGRIPLGVQVWPFGQSFEVFLEVAPAVGLSIVPTGFEWHLQGALGFRFWF